MESTKIVEHLRKVRLRNEELALLEQSFVIVPYLISGYQDYGNSGIITHQRFVNDYETFKRIWTGNDTVSICWKDSFRVVQNENGEMESQYQLGDFFLGIIETNNFSNNLERDTAFSDYIKQEQVNTITFRVHNIFEINDNYNFYLYKIPELSKSTLYRIESIEKDFAVGTKELLGYVITFRTINQELATTGKAKQQNITNSAPGQGYLECEVKDQIWFNESGKDLVENVDYIKTYGKRYIVASRDKFQHRPVVKANIKFLGAAIPCSIAFVGRRVDSLNSNKWGAQELIFLKDIENDLTPTLFRTQQNQQNFYFGSFKTTLSQEKDFFKYLKDMFGSINKIDFNGWLQYSMKNIEKTNPTRQDSTYGDTYTNVLDKNWSFTFDRTRTVTGQSGVDTTIRVSGNKTLDNHLFFNFWSQKDIAYLPTNKKESLGLKVANAMLDFSLLGVVLNFFNGTLLSKIGDWFGRRPFFTGICGIISAPFLDMNDDYWKDTLQAQYGDRMPMNFLENDKDNPSSIFFRSDTINTSFSGTLTNKFRKNNVIYNTLEIGQKQFENGNYIYTSDRTKPLLINGEEQLVDKTTLGFIIDKILIQSIGKCDISVEFLDNSNEVVWSGIFQSEAKWTDSFREIWTIRDTSLFGRENMYFSKEIPYPKALTIIGATEKPTYQEHKLEIFEKQWRNTTYGARDFILWSKETSANWFEKRTRTNIFDREDNKAYSPYIFDIPHFEYTASVELGGLFNDYRNENKVLNLDFIQNLYVPDTLCWFFGEYSNPDNITTRINCDLHINSFNTQVLFNDFELNEWKSIELPRPTNNKIYEKDSIEIWNYNPLDWLDIRFVEKLVNGKQSLFLEYSLRLIHRNSGFPENPRILTFYKTNGDSFVIRKSEDYFKYGYYIKIRI